MILWQTQSKASLTTDQKNSQKINRAVANDLNHPELKHWWIYLGYLHMGWLLSLFFPLILIYVHIDGCFIKETNILCRNIDTLDTLRWFPFVGLYRHSGQRQKCLFTPMSQSQLPDRLIKGHNYFPWDLSICPSLTAGGGNCFPTLGKCRRFWLLPPIQRDPWDVSHYQLPAPTTRTHREQGVLPRIWPRYRVSPSARISHNRLELNVHVAFFKTVKENLVKYCGPKYWGFFSPISEMGKAFHLLQDRE